MIKIGRNHIFISILLTLGLLIASCHKENTTFNYNEAIETVGDYVEAQQMTHLLLNTYFKSISDSVLLADGTNTIDGANVSYTSDPAKIIISYPWCIFDGYGHIREGVFEATSPTGFFDSLDVIDFTFTGFIYDNDTISVGNLSITNKGLTSNQNYSFDVLASNIVRQTVDSVEVVTNLTFDVEQNFILNKDVTSTFYTQNDFFNITGNIRGLARSSFPFYGVISDTSALQTSYSCNWIKSGITNIELTSFISDATSNFSYNTQCANEYSIITNSTLFTKAFDDSTPVCGE